MLSYPISVFLDTNIFIEAKYDFSSKGIFSTLIKYIIDGKIELYTSDIVANETKKHLSDDISKLCNAFKDARKNVLSYLSPNILNELSIANLIEGINKDELKKEIILLFDKFIDESKMTVLDNKGVDCNQIIFDYFEGLPPFEKNDCKKYEFPDAIMAAKLKLLFKDDKPIYIISKDSGFRNSFKNQESFHTFESLKDILNLINMETARYEDIKQLVFNKHSSICDLIKEELSNEVTDVDGLDYDRKGLCEGYYYDDVYIEDISEVDFEFSSLDDITEDRVYVTLSCTASITAICSYFDESNSAWDSEEGKFIISQWVLIEEKHCPNFDSEIVFSIKQKSGGIDFEIESINLDVSLDQWSRVSRHENIDEFYIDYNEKNDDIDEDVDYIEEDIDDIDEDVDYIDEDIDDIDEDIDSYYISEYD